jgi:hypothetical protein
MVRLPISGPPALMYPAISAAGRAECALKTSAMAALMVGRAGEATFSVRFGFGFRSRGLVDFLASSGSSARNSRSAIRRSATFASSSAIFARMSSLAAAGFPRSCSVLVCTGRTSTGGHSYAKTSGGPFDGFFVSMTTLVDERTDERGHPVHVAADYKRYVDSTSVPYIAVASHAMRVFRLQRGWMAEANQANWLTWSISKTAKHRRRYSPMLEQMTLWVKAP